MTYIVKVLPTATWFNMATSQKLMAEDAHSSTTHLLRSVAQGACCGSLFLDGLNRIMHHLSKLLALRQRCGCMLPHLHQADVNVNGHIQIVPLDLVTLVAHWLTE